MISLVVSYLDQVKANTVSKGVHIFFRAQAPSNIVDEVSRISMKTCVIREENFTIMKRLSEVACSFSYWLKCSTMLLIRLLPRSLLSFIFGLNYYPFKPLKRFRKGFDISAKVEILDI